MIDREAKDLVALIWFAHRLEDQLLPVGRPVRLGVLDPVRELSDVGEVNLPRVVERAFGGGRLDGEGHPS